MENKLYYGDNLKILREHISDNSIDLVYLDPPFNSGKNYNILFKEPNGFKSEAQIKAFDDTWHWTESAENTFHDLVNNGPSKLVDLLKSFRGFLGENDTMAYLTMMAIRLIELKRVLKPSGSIYLHCDPTASHYLKILLDIIYLPNNFRNEIIWHYRRWTGKARRFQRLHDVIFFYTKSDNYVFNVIYTDYTEGSVERKMQGVLHRFKGNEAFLVSEKSVDEKGVRENDVWQIPFIPPSAKERLGYPTQKPIELLKRIIMASSKENEIILDPFCGCGTTIDAAIELSRKWIGIDITHLAINLIKNRIYDRYKDSIKYKVIGEPEDIHGAIKLASEDRYQFQWWALSLVKARPVNDERKKGADYGIDGIKFFQDSIVKNDIKKIIIQVKSGHVQVKDIRELITVTKNNDGTIGTLITLENPSENMKREAISEGFYICPFNKTKYPKIQILTIEDLFKDKNIEYFNVIDETFKKSERHFDKSQYGKQDAFFNSDES